MKELTRLFRIIELTRSQPQYGYVLAGIKKDDLSNLAEHHYLVTFIAWQLALNLNQLGAGLNIQKVLEYCLIHDLGEVFGGDIAFPYARVNKRAKKLASEFEKENQKYISRFFGNNSKFTQKLFAEIMDAKTDESLVAKLADYIECWEYKYYVQALGNNEVALAREKLGIYLKKIKNPILKKHLPIFIEEWLKSLKQNKSDQSWIQ